MPTHQLNQFVWRLQNMTDGCSRAVFPLRHCSVRVATLSRSSEQYSRERCCPSVPLFTSCVRLMSWSHNATVQLTDGTTRIA